MISTATCPSTTPAAVRAAATAGRSSSGTSARSVTRAFVVLSVRGDDALDELVAHDVLAAEPDEVNVLDRSENPRDLDQAGALIAVEIDLRHVTRHDHLGLEPEAGEEHLHLLRARVLSLVEDDERVIE